MIFSIKKIILCFCLSSISVFVINAQDWKVLKQDSLNLIYEIPRSWFVGGVMNEKTCHCTAGTLNSSLKDGINMVIFTSSEAHPNINLKAQEVWGYHYEENNLYDILKTSYFEYKMSISHWQEDYNLRVLRLYTEYKNKPLLLYFWSDKATIDKEQDLIFRIIYSLRPLQN